MDEREQIGIIESVMFMAGEPVALKDIAALFEISEKEARTLMENAINCFNFERRGLQIICLANSVISKYVAVILLQKEIC